MKWSLTGALASGALVSALALGCVSSKPLGTMGRLTLDPAKSTLSAVAMKNESVPVTVKFPGLSGWADASGQAELSIPISSLDTGNPARDANIKDLFFEVAKKAAFGSATFKLKATDAPVGALKGGQSLATRGEGVLSLHGAEISVAGPLTLKREGKLLKVDLGEEGWTILIDKSGMTTPLKNLNKHCPQPHRVGNKVVVKGTLAFKA